jgi:cytochrome P450
MPVQNDMIFLIIKPQIETNARDTISFDLIDPAVHPIPDECSAWAMLRAERPVVWVAPTDDRPGFWALTKHNDVVAGYRSPCFSSLQGNMLGTMMTGGDPASGRMLVVTDPPRHTLLRRQLQSGFSRVLESIGEAIHGAAEQLVARAVDRESCEFVSEIASQILGVPESDRQKMLDMTSASLGEEGTKATDAGAAARRDILMYYAHLLAKRRNVPAEDIVSLMAGIEVEGKPLSNTEIILNCYNILIGGNETTRVTTTGGILALIENQSQWEALKDSESAISGAVHEILRWSTPATYQSRLVTEDYRVRNQLIEGGEIVTLWHCSANRDEEVFDRPYTFDISRSPNPHVTFGSGRHACMGAPIARFQIAAMLRALRNRVAGIELLEEPQRLNSTFLAGIKELHVRLISA